MPTPTNPSEIVRKLPIKLGATAYTQLAEWQQRMGLHNKTEGLRAALKTALDHVDAGKAG